MISQLSSRLDIFHTLHNPFSFFISLYLLSISLQEQINVKQLLFEKIILLTLPTFKEETNSKF